MFCQNRSALLSGSVQLSALSALDGRSEFVQPHVQNDKIHKYCKKEKKKKGFVLLLCLRILAQNTSFSACRCLIKVSLMDLISEKCVWSIQILLFSVENWDPFSWMYQLLNPSSWVLLCFVNICRAWRSHATSRIPGMPLRLLGEAEAKEDEVLGNAAEGFHSFCPCSGRPSSSSSFSPVSQRKSV